MKKKIFLLLFVVALTLLALVSCSNAEPQPNRATVTVDAGRGELTVVVMPDPELLEQYKDATLYLYALEPGKTEVDLSSEVPVTSAVAAESLTFKLPLVEKGVSRLYHSFMAAYIDESGGYIHAIEAPGYVVNPEAFAENKSEYKQNDSIKGLNAEYDLDAIELGVANAVIEIAAEDYILPTPNSEALAHICVGESFYFDRTAIERLDERVKLYTQNGVTVYFRFVLKTEQNDLPEELACLAYADASDETYYPINMTDSRAAAYMTGLLDFMAERYTRPDGMYGLCSNFIAGKALNVPPDGVGASTNQRASAILVRTMYIAMASHYSNGRVFITSGNNRSNAYSFLGDFAKRAEEGGDYPWGIALSVRAASAESDRIWYDDGGGGKYITPSNINTVTGIDFLGREDMMYRDKERNLIVSDFSVELKDTEISPELQAASYAYAYYKFAAAEKVDAMIYSYQTDTVSKQAGLRSVDDEGNPEKTRRSWQVFRDIDTDADINSFVSSYIRDDELWKPLYSETATKVRIKRSRTGSTALGVNPEDYSPSTLFGFDDGGMQGFRANGEGSYAGLVRIESGSALKAYFPKMPAGKAYVSRSGITAAELSQNNLLVTVLLEPEPESTTSRYNIELTLIQDNPSIDAQYVSKISGVTAGTPITLVFDIGPFREVMQNGEIELRLSAVGNDGAGCSLRIDSIMSGKVQKNTWLIVLLILLAVLAVVAMVALAIIWYRKKRESGGKIRLPFAGKLKKSKKKLKDDITDDDIPR